MQFDKYSHFIFASPLLNRCQVKKERTSQLSPDPGTGFGHFQFTVMEVVPFPLAVVSSENNPEIAATGVPRS